MNQNWAQKTFKVALLLDKENLASWQEFAVWLFLSRHVFAVPLGNGSSPQINEAFRLTLAKGTDAGVGGGKEPLWHWNGTQFQRKECEC